MPVFSIRGTFSIRRKGLVGWTSIYQLFWCSPGVQGFDTLPHSFTYFYRAGVSSVLWLHFRWNRPPVCHQIGEKSAPPTLGRASPSGVGESLRLPKRPALLKPSEHCTCRVVTVSSLCRLCVVSVSSLCRHCVVTVITTAVFSYVLMFSDVFCGQVTTFP